MPQSTKISLTITFNPEYVFVEKRGFPGGLETKAIPRDGKLAQVLADIILGFEPKQEKK